MGEKYDCYDYDMPRFQIPQALASRRVGNPVGEGFPPARYGEMQQGGDAAKAALAEYAARPSETAKTAASSSVQLLRDASDGDPATRLAAGQQVVDNLNQCFTDVQKQTAQANLTYQMLSDHGSIPDRDLAEIARGSARDLKQSVTDDMGPLEAVINTVLGTAQDAALNAVGAQAEAAVNRIGQFAYTNTAGLYNAMTRRGMVDVPEATDPAA